MEIRQPCWRLTLTIDGRQAHLSFTCCAFCEPSSLNGQLPVSVRLAFALFAFAFDFGFGFAFTLHLATLSGSDGLLKLARYDKCVSLLAGTIKEAIARWIWILFGEVYLRLLMGDVNGKT